MSNNNQWVGGKQAYESNQDQEKPASDDWLSELTGESLGFNNAIPVGWKPKNRTVDIKKKKRNEY